MGINIILILCAYLIGSVPTAYWFGKLFYKIDIRTCGSGNSGATNTMRILGTKPALIVLIIDMLKGFSATMLHHFLPFDSPDIHFPMMILLGIVCVIGHIFPVFANFRGGKGIASSFGALIGISPLSALIILGVFSIILIISHFVSLSSLISALLFPFVIYFTENQEGTMVWILCSLLSLIIFISHHKNIQRIFNGTENEFSFGNKNKKRQ
jgi:acyl phosphate:glycerol-3-phosphate acyltransferase